MKMSATEVALYVFVLGSAISFAIAGLIQGTFWVIRLTRKEDKGGAGGAA
ncbi:MAG TPA: hypothetical protein VGK67_36985 [Myxococcales bacterium]|jgi:hypothetical protein